MRDRIEARRKRAVGRIRAQLLARRSPRAEMSLIVAAAGTAGFLCSFVLLHLGLRLMWLRYGLAIAFAYGIFFVLVAVWLALERRRVARQESHSLDSKGDILDFLDLDFGGGGAGRSAARFTGGGGRFGGGGASATFDQADGAAADCPVPARAPESLGHSASTGGGVGKHIGLGLDLDEVVVIVAVVAAIVAAIAASVWVVVSAPELFAEVLFDGVLSAGLYRRLRRLNHRQWWEGAVRHTWLPVLVTALTFSAAGYLMQRYAPEAASIGAVWRHLTEPGE
jgi:hypothetical protein